jgi:hypothetical protein
MRANTVRSNNQLVNEFVGTLKFFQEKVFKKNKKHASLINNNNKDQKIVHTCTKCQADFIVIRPKAYENVKIDYCDDCIPF